MTGAGSGFHIAINGLRIPEVGERWTHRSTGQLAYDIDIDTVLESSTVAVDNAVRVSVAGTLLLRPSAEPYKLWAGTLEQLHGNWRPPVPPTPEYMIPKARTLWFGLDAFGNPIIDTASSLRSAVVAEAEATAQRFGIRAYAIAQYRLVPVEGTVEAL